MEKEEFTKYETARIIGARALQIAMDAPILLKISEAELKEIRYNPLRIAERELEEEVLPIAVRRPNPQKRKERLKSVKDDGLSDEELIAKAQEVEKEIAQEAKEIGLINEGEDEDETVGEVSSEAAKEE
jgi:DNA-directed RNA polymerase subunit K